MKSTLSILRQRWDSLPRHELRRLQAAQCRDFLLRRVVPYSAYYRDLFKREHLNPAKLVQLEDLQH
ncbi:MAG: hypothetical protein O3C57_07485, partial [Verrucomicrobia bacterium]|nr:hypothetical protein [Verrucomicrobiota bacterium]